MDHLINPKDVGVLSRPVSVGVADSKIATYINEAEQGNIKPALGAAMLIDLLDNPNTAANKLILDGDRRFAGVRTALAYYTWAKIVKNNPVNVTRFGVTVKNDEHSQPIDFKSILKIHDESVSYADRCMAEVAEYIGMHADDYPLYAGAVKTGRKASKVYVIGD